ncbi:peptidylprolyl isomerase [Roseicitreum antarcticum]|uniref:Parvulin-like PPIase n=1 Tax=Roseicitreum antarcticum TaxID=564137 RepID=A0A1H3AXC7_9RHOB|nr:peptidylprolyl isomerase [Roseicitreum antarcticum]SDX34362.1 peptidyl-prolyl cis-trans isomerase C [Roseicitreum antarcticum]
MSKHSNLIVSGALALLVALPATAQDTAQDAPTPQTVLATVGGTEITLGHVIAMRSALPEQFQSLPDATLFPALTEQLIEQTALAQSIEDDLTFVQQITLENETRNFTANAALTRAAEASVSDEAITAAYDAFVVEFSGQEPTPEFNAAHILVETEEEATTLRAELEEGADFATLARENSTDGAAAGGGALGWFGPGMMIPAFEEAVMAMEVGEISQPIETQFGWHIVQLNETRMSTAPALEEVREELAAEIQREAARNLIEDLTAATEISRSFEDLDPSVLSNVALDAE